MPIQQRVVAKALESLQGHGFERDPQRTPCIQLTRQLTRKIETLTGPIAQAFEDRMQATTGKERMEVFSEGIEKLTRLWHLAAPRFKDHIVAQEALDLGSRNRISCEAAAMHLDALSNAWRDAEIEFDALKKAVPSSPKAQRKRRARAGTANWLPWPF